MGAVAVGRALDGDAAEAVADGGLLLHDADDACGVHAVGGNGAAGGATADGQRAGIVRLADQGGGIEIAGVGGSFGADDVCLHVAVGHIYIAALQGDESGGVAMVGGGDVAHHVETADDGVVVLGVTLHVAEGGAVVVGSGVVEGQRMVPPVESAGEVVVAAARHARHGDVVGQHDGLAREVALGVLGQQVAEYVPATGGADGVGVSILCEPGRHGAVVRGDVGDGVAAAYAAWRDVLAGNLAGGVVVALEGALQVVAGDGTVGVIFDGGYGGADDEVVAKGAAAVFASYAAEGRVGGSVGEGEGDSAGAAADGAIVV